MVTPQKTLVGKRDQIPSIGPASEGGQWSGSAGPRVRGVIEDRGKNGNASKEGARRLASKIGKKK